MADAGREVVVTRVYFEMRSARELRPAAEPVDAPRLVRERGEPSLWRRLYAETGRDYHWVDRLGWTDAEIAAFLARHQSELWTARGKDDEIVGWFQLDLHDDGTIELGYFGLLPGNTGRGWGGWLLARAVERAWALAPARVWVHTCTLDHPAAIPNYVARGFVPVRWETYSTRLLAHERDPFPLDAAALVNGRA